MKKLFRVTPGGRFWTDIAYPFLLAIIIFVYCAPQVQKALPEVFSKDEQYITDPAMSYTTGMQTRSIRGLFFGYGDLPISLNAIPFFVYKQLWIAEKLFSDDVVVVKKQKRSVWDSAIDRYKGYEKEFYINYFQDPTVPMTQARLLSLLFTLGSLLLLFYLARGWLPAWQAFLVSLLFLVLPPVSRMAVSAKVEMILVFMTLLFIYSGVKIIQNGRMKYFLLCGLGVGLAFATKPNALLYLLPFAVLLYYAIKKWKTVHQIPIYRYLLFSLGGFFLALVWLGPNYFVNTMLNGFSRIPIHYFIEGKLISYAQTPGVILLNLLYDTNWVYAILGFAGLGLFLTQRSIPKEIRIFIGVFLFIAIIPFVFNKQFIKTFYLLPVLPLMSFSVVYILNGISKMSQFKNNGLLTIFLWAVLPITFVLVLLPTYGIIQQNIAAGDDTRVIAKEWILKNIQKGDRIFLFGRYEAMPQISSRLKLGDDRRRSEKYNRVFKDYYAEYLNQREVTADFMVEDYTNRTYVREEFEETLNWEHIINNSTDYIIYNPSYFDRFNGENFSYQRSVVDAFAMEIKENAELIKTFHPGEDAQYGPGLLVYKVPQIASVVSDSSNYHQ